MLDIDSFPVFKATISSACYRPWIYGLKGQVTNTGILNMLLSLLLHRKTSLSTS